MLSDSLKKGNFMKDRNGKTFAITASDLVAISLSEKNGEVNKDYNTITLTGDIAEKFGFEPVTSNRWKLKGFHGFELISTTNGGDYLSAVKYMDDSSYYIVVNAVMTVHHLQNLYYFMAEKELKPIKKH